MGQDCPARAVCLGVLEKVMTAVPSAQHGDKDAVDTALRGYCRTATGRENRFVRRAIRCACCAWPSGPGD